MSVIKVILSLILVISIELWETMIKFGLLVLVLLLPIELWRVLLDDHTEEHIVSIVTIIIISISILYGVYMLVVSG